MFVLSGEERALDGTPQESAARTQSTWLKWPLWFKQSLALSPGNWTLSSSLSVLKWQFPLLAENCLPYHQPFSYSLRPRQCWSLLVFMLSMVGSAGAYYTRALLLGDEDRTLHGTPQHFDV